MSSRKQKKVVVEEESKEILSEDDIQLMEEVQNPDKAFDNISIPPYMIRRYVEQLGLARKKSMKGGLGFDGRAHATIALTYSFIMSKILLSAKAFMKGDGNGKTLTNHAIQVHFVFSNLFYDGSPPLMGF